MACLGLRIAGGGGFTAPVGSVRSIKPAKKRGLAVVELLWGRKHGRNSGSSRTNTMTVVGDAAKLKRRWLALKEAG